MLACLQVVHGVGGLKHATFRSFEGSNSRTVEARGFIDGNLVENTLELSRDELASVRA
jgi:hypothetical protein